MSKFLKFITGHKLYILIGLAGVDHRERLIARRWGKVFSFLIMFVSIALLLEWEIDILGHLDSYERLLTNWLIWIYFVTNITVLTYLVKNKLRFISANWLLLVVIILGIPLVLNVPWFIAHMAGWRPLLAFVIIIPSVRLLLSFFVDGQLSTTLFAATIIIVIFGILVAGVDPNIKSAWDGIWWAIATVSTVGYGDIVPTTLIGRAIGTLLVILGLGIFVSITANFLALTLRREASELHEEEGRVKAIADEMKNIKITQDRILHLIQRLEHQLKNIK